jgi:hypothetical protein
MPHRILVVLCLVDDRNRGVEQVIGSSVAGSKDSVHQPVRLRLVDVPNVHLSEPGADCAGRDGDQL